MLRRRFICLVMALAIVGGCATAPLQAERHDGQIGITKGPALLRVYQDRVAVMWETSAPGLCNLHYGQGDKASMQIRSIPRRVTYEVKPKGRRAYRKTAYIHKVWVRNLKAGQVYGYRILGQDIKSGAYSFRTVPADTDKTRFVVYGDTRTNPDIHEKLVKLIIRQKVDFVVHVGDMLASGNKYEQWGPQHFKPVKGLVETVPMYIIKGNHEGTNGNYEKLLIPPGERNNFAFDYGPVHFFCGDNSNKKTRPAELLRLIAEDARSSDARWKFVSVHKPIVNFAHHWSAWGHPEAIPALSRANIDFVFVGHSHLYERFRPVEPGPGAYGGYVTYITTGGGGAPLHEIDQMKYHAYTKETNQFCLFEIDGDKLKMDVIDIEGNVIDRLRLTKSRGELNKEYLGTAAPMADILSYQKKNLSKEH